MEAPLVSNGTPTNISLEAEPLKNTRIITAIVVLIQGMIVAIYAPGVADVISILGGSFGTLIMLVCPAIIYCSVFREEMESRKSKFMIGLLGGASCVSAVAVFATVMKWI